MNTDTMTLEEIGEFLNSQTTLQRIDNVVKTFQRSIEGTKAPVFVPIRPRGDSIPNDCFENVARQVEECGGEVVHGWRIYIMPGLFLEAEFHAVWKAPDGRLVDVSLPPEEGTSRIVFFPDPTRSFQGEPIPSIHWPLAKMKELNEYLKAFEEDRLAIRESVRSHGIAYNEPIPRDDPTLEGPRIRLVAATLALARCARRRAPR